ncbi:hypothetical protein SynRS9907_00955 [Synechococcus sp. RS9907]|nr:hypothetical protein SynRS9907_00955 [Synechococcus sp. RS9907]
MALGQTSITTLSSEVGLNFCGSRFQGFELSIRLIEGFVSGLY